MARTVADAAALLGALTGVDPQDDATGASTGQARAEYTGALDPNGLKGARLGVCRSHFMGYSPATDALMETALEAVKRLGAIVVDPADITTAGQFDDSEVAVLLYGFKADLTRYLPAWAPAALRGWCRWGTWRVGGWGCRSWDGPGAKQRSSSWRTPTSARRKRGDRHASSRRPR